MVPDFYFIIQEAAGGNVKDCTRKSFVKLELMNGQILGAQCERLTH